MADAGLEATSKKSTKKTKKSVSSPVSPIAAEIAEAEAAPSEGQVEAQNGVEKSSEADARTEDLFIVGIGASAGGLEPIRDLFRNLTEPAPAAYVILQHLSPKHESLLATIVRRDTHLEVCTLTDGETPRANMVYVTPPNCLATFENGRFVLSDPELSTGGPRPSIDRFFFSLAESIGERAVGVIVSGTGSDGAFGMQAVRGAGGITIAQDDSSAKYDGMPLASIETGCVDVVLRASEIGKHLGSILASPHDIDRLRHETPTRGPLNELLAIVFARTRVDFRDYKPNMIKRRLARRMTALGIDAEEDYLTICRSDPQEVDALFRDFLVSVTWFFRDPHEFEALSTIVRDVVARREHRQIRVWIAACATGEEAYTIAMLFAETLGGVDKLSKERIQIFASDIDESALRVAKRGVYPAAALDRVPQEFIEKYFISSGDSVSIHPNLKDIVVFSQHNICQDAPFINVDLICCRNLLIYFGAMLQSRVLSRLNYALVEDGVIMLGTAESVTVSEDLFVRIGQKAQIYRKRRATLPPQMFPVGSANTGRTPTRIDPRDKRDRDMFGALARSISENSILISDDHRILRVFGDIGKYVTMNEGSQLEMSLGILKAPLARETKLLSAIALRSGKRREGAAHTLEAGSDERVRVEALPITSAEHEERLVLLKFESWFEVEVAHDGDADARPGSGSYIDQLEKELTDTREALQQTLEELETSNEELQSSNEELQATNEELQAINEELETSNEELQSSNEELMTLNEELQVSATQLSMANDEVGSILRNMMVPMIIIDNALQITKASKEAVELLGIHSPQSAPHLSQCDAASDHPDLVGIANETLRLGGVASHRFEVGARAYAMTCAPVVSEAGQLKGATMTFLDMAQASV